MMKIVQLALLIFVIGSSSSFGDCKKSDILDQQKESYLKAREETDESTHFSSPNHLVIGEKVILQKLPKIEPGAKISVKQPAAGSDGQYLYDYGFWWTTGPFAK